MEEKNICFILLRCFGVSGKVSGNREVVMKFSDHHESFALDLCFKENLINFVVSTRLRATLGFREDLHLLGENLP